MTTLHLINRLEDRIELLEQKIEQIKQALRGEDAHEIVISIAELLEVNLEDEK